MSSELFLLIFASLTFHLLLSCCFFRIALFCIRFFLHYLFIPLNCSADFAMEIEMPPACEPPSYAPYPVVNTHSQSRPKAAAVTQHQLQLQHDSASASTSTGATGIRGDLTGGSGGGGGGQAVCQPCPSSTSASSSSSSSSGIITPSLIYQ